MYIRNKKTGVTQECHNKDVIRICQKDPEHYEVTRTKPQTVKQEKVGTLPKETKSLDTMSAAELRKIARENGLAGYEALSKGELLEILKDVM